MATPVNRPALELLMTGGLTETRSEFEQLHDAQDLAAWLGETFHADRPVRASASDLDAAVALREAIFSTIRRRTIKETPDPGSVAIINAAAEPAPLTPLLDATTTARRWREPIGTVAALSTLARDAIEALSGADGHRVRECANPLCELVFVDTSPPGARRWCAMRRCGNRSKTRAYRSRNASSPSEGTPQ